MVVFKCRVEPVFMLQWPIFFDSATVDNNFRNIRYDKEYMYDTFFNVLYDNNIPHVW